MKKIIILTITLLFIQTLALADVLTGTDLQAHAYICNIHDLRPLSDGDIIVMIRKGDNFLAISEAGKDLPIQSYSQKYGQFVLKNDNGNKKEIFALLLLALQEQKSITIRLEATITNGIYNNISYVILTE